MVELAGNDYDRASMGTNFGHNQTTTGHDGVERPAWENLWVDGLEQIKRLLAGGGVMAFRQKFSTTTTAADPGAGYLSFNHATISSATAAYIDLLETGGSDISGIIGCLAAGSSAVKGNLMVGKLGALDAWWLFRVTAVASPSGYRNLTIAFVASGGGSLAADDELIVAFQEKGDKGETGTAATIAVGSVATGAAGSSATVTNSGTSGAAVLDFQIPRGDTGATPIVSTTSTTSRTIGAGAKTFTTAAALDLLAGAEILVTDQAAPATNWMLGPITSIVGTSVTIDVTDTGGSGTIAAWNLNLSAPRGSVGATGPTGNNKACEGGTAGGTANAPSMTCSPAFTGARGEVVSFLTGASASNSTVTITANGVGQDARFNGAAFSSTVTLPASTRVSFISDGTLLHLIALTSAASGGGLPVTNVTGTSQQAAVNSAYLANNASQVTVTLPTTAAVGDRVEVIGWGAGGWRIAQNASQTITYGTNFTTTAGTGDGIVSSSRYDSVVLVCTTANTGWSVELANGVFGRSGANGYWLTGTNVDKLNFSTETASNNFVAAPSAGNNDVGFNNLTTGYTINSGSTALYKMPFSTETFATVATARPGITARCSKGSSTIKGYTLGGALSGVGATAVIYALTYSGETQAALGATLGTAADYVYSGFSSSSACYVLGTSAPAATIQKLTFGTETTSTPSATLSSARTSTQGTHTALAGYAMGGGASVATIDRLTFASDTDTAISATLPTGVNTGGGVSSVSKGYAGTGYTGSNTNIIQALTFSDETTATLSAVLGTARQSPGSFQSGVYS